MVHLRLTGVSEDGRTLLLVSDAKVEFTVDIDDRLRAALRGDQPRLAQLEMQMDSTLRPRDIQARIRSGETPETVAQVAGTSVDKVMPYAAPVLAERAHVAERAQRASLRRRPAEAGGAGRTLGDAVGSHLRQRNVDPDTVVWDAWRREDGRWTLTGAFTTGDRVGAAHFSFDAPGNYVVADDEDAHWLLGEIEDEVTPTEDQEPQPTDDLSTARRRRLSAVPAEELPLGEDALELVSEDHAALGAEAPLEAYLDDASDDATDDGDDDGDDDGQLDLTTGLDETDQDEEDTDDTVGDDEGADHLEEDAAEHIDHPDEPPSRKPVKKSRGRASVPSWDEIMFGGGSGSQD